MEKTGQIKQGITPDTEKRLQGEKAASAKRAEEVLDDDVTRRLAKAAAEKLK